jgi:hypothetical protein
VKSLVKGVLEFRYRFPAALPVQTHTRCSITERLFLTINVHIGKGKTDAGAAPGLLNVGAA